MSELPIPDHYDPRRRPLRAVAHPLAERRAYLKTRAELSELTARQLADIGLVRANIDSVARKSARVAAPAPVPSAYLGDVFQTFEPSRA